LTWDLLNDGIGNPKKTKSMLWAHETPPSMITGIRDSAEMAVRAGIRHILFTEVNELKAQEIDAFLSSLRPVPSPFLEDNKLSEKALKGKLVFEAAGCKRCHSGAYYTDGNLYDIYSAHSNDEKARFDTPSLSETWRNAPYLHDGRAATMREVLVDFNKNGTHGKTGNLTDEELNCLLEYVLSL
jgi:cytochrome c peroxidase